MEKKIHILGVCGTAMAAIAALAKGMGWRVTGSDAGVYPPMSDYLEGLGVEIAPFNVANLKPAPDLCVIGNAMSRGNVEVEYILDEGLACCSGPQFVGDYILPGRHAVVVAGTHGKTTTSSLLAYLLEQAGLAPGFLIGGIPEDFATGARQGEGVHFVLEGDEYDTAFFDKRSKFLHYHARTLILNNLEYDHADIFADLAAIQTQFYHLIRTVPAAGNIIVNADDVNLEAVLKRGCWTPIIRFSRYGGCDAEWQWQLLSEDGSRFQLYHHHEMVMEVEWGMIGQHQVANACAVAAAATAMGVEATVIAEALRSFSGIRRRMTLVGEARGVRIFDDFAHHPTAIRGVVAGAKAAMKTAGRLWVVVEPRSNTMRTRIHQQTLPACFMDADQVVFVPPSDRNLAPEELLDIDAVCQAIGAKATVLPDVGAIIARLTAHLKSGDQVLVLSNGGFDAIHQRLLKALKV
ncbi:MAG: UDP-N-acetylmuramate:L-alanyl-gamma-D-glutamyl-meso-diaminopimelate ligase [Mariprofundus sp.]|nr:UDP-N-acetylmuramate:L-alanyl-gamma-D-glutamyl-meso-diaminopimelate ligase [Mariprofundus sp.]